VARKVAGTEQPKVAAVDCGERTLGAEGRRSGCGGVCCAPEDGDDLDEGGNQE
jgi:hypothetical protein